MERADVSEMAEVEYNSPDGVPLRTIHGPILRHQVGVNTAMVVVLEEHVSVVLRVAEGEMSEHLVISSPCLVAAPLGQSASSQVACESFIA